MGSRESSRHAAAQTADEGRYGGYAGAAAASSPLAPEKASARHGPGDAQCVFERLVVAGGDPVDESEVDGDREDFEAADAGAHDHFALQIESFRSQADIAQKICGVETEAALRIGDVRP